MELFLEVFLMAAVVASGGWMIRRMRRRETPVEEASAGQSGDPFARVSVPRKNSPKGRTGAVAVAEPDEENYPDLFPPRTF
jgi:hypothetical protein